VQWAVLNCETETGVTIMQMDEGMDTGDILLTEKITIEPDDTAGSLMTRMAALGGQALARALDLLRAGKLPPRKQDDSLATLAPPLTKEMGFIDWAKPAAAIGCLIRGLDPWPTAHTLVQGSRLRLFSPKPFDSASDCAFMEQQLASRGVAALPGTICHTGPIGFVVACGRQYLLIREVQPEGGRRMPAAAYLAGHPLAIGERLGGSGA
jgi:methionyl-tRNA formyltransferase